MFGNILSRIKSFASGFLPQSQPSDTPRTPTIPTEFKLDPRITTPTDFSKVTATNFGQRSSGVSISTPATRNAIPTQEQINMANQINDVVKNLRIQMQQNAGQSSSVNVQKAIDEATGGKPGPQSIRPTAKAPRGGFGTPGTTKLLDGVAVQYDQFGYPRGATGFSGGSGSGGGSFSQTPIPTSGQTGGSPNFTGTLTSIGGLGPTTLTQEEGDEETISSETLQGAVNYLSPALQRLNFEGDSLSAVMRVAHSQPAANAPLITNNYNADSVQQGAQLSPLTRETIGNTLAQIEQNALTIKDFLDRGGLDAPVEDTEAQIEFIQQQDDPYGIGAAMDAYRMQNTQLMQLQSERQEMFNGIRAITQSYEAVYEDIRKNPNLPKGLAQRRLEHLYQKEKGILDNYSLMLQQLNLAIDDQNQMVNRAFNIVESAQQREQQMFTNRMQMLNFYVNSGAIAGMSDYEIDEMSQAFGINPRGLARIRDVKLEEQEKRDLSLQKLDNGDLVIVDVQKGKIVSNLGGRAPKKDTEPKDQKLTSVDVQRYNELYPTAGITPGDTQEDAARKVQEVQTLAMRDLEDTVKDRAEKGQSNDAMTLQRLFPELSAVQIQQGVQSFGVSQSTLPQTSDSFFSRIFSKEWWESPLEVSPNIKQKVGPLF